MLTLRPSTARGHARYDWLDTRHTFSFDSYYDPRHLGFRSLRVINEDLIGPGGFPLHPHRDMEIVTLIVAGELEHGDSLGHREIIGAGDLQHISAGRGIRHSEGNPSTTTPVHLLQIWIEPSSMGGDPDYATHRGADAGHGLIPLASPDGREGTLRLKQDAFLFSLRLNAGERIALPLSAGRGQWLQVIAGTATVNEQLLQAGDGLAVEEEELLRIVASSTLHLLLFDLA